MKQKYSYSECYQILTLNPGCTWDELRKTYKQQIQKWHPDRFVDNINEKSAADEKIKHIIAAYQQLAAYYRKHNNLPNIEPPLLITRTIETPSAKPSAFQNTSISSSPFSPKHKKPKAQKKAPVIFSLVTVGIVMYFAMQFLPQSDFQEKTTGKNLTQNITAKTTPKQIIDNDTNQSIADDTKTDSGKEKLITYGSSISEVIIIQGVPTRQEGDIWYYGDSEIYFKQGTVTGWKRAPNSDLKVSLIPQKKDTPINQ